MPINSMEGKDNKENACSFLTEPYPFLPNNLKVGVEC